MGGRWDGKNGKPTSEVHNSWTALKPVDRLYGDMPVDEFGSNAMLACQQWLIDKPLGLLISVVSCSAH